MKPFAAFTVVAASLAAFACTDATSPVDAETMTRSSPALSAGVSSGGWRAGGHWRDQNAGLLAIFNAVSGTGGNDARGNWYFRQIFQGVEIEEFADVTCLLISGNTATIGIRFTEPTTNPGRPVGSYALIWVVDNGNASSNGAPDTWGASGVLESAPTCDPGSTETEWGGDIGVGS